MDIYRTLRISAIRQETAACKSFFLEPEDGERLIYAAGQFLTFVFKKETGEERRSYSISSTPSMDEPLCITVKRQDNGEYSRRFIDYAKVGDRMLISGVAGFFVLPNNVDMFGQFFFMAAGSGITPILPLIKSLLYGYPHARIILIYSNRAEADTIFYETIRELARKFSDRFTVEFLFSTAANLERARLSKWLLARLFAQHSCCGPQETMCYTCGPFDYMRMVTIALLEAGVSLQHIRKENFTHLKIDTGLQPPDKTPHNISIAIDKKAYRFTTAYPKTILQAAREQGISLPYSCESGRCGSCALTCLNGKVWMSYNEVLLDSEIEKGRVLTCVGFPIFGDVSLRLE